MQLISALTENANDVEVAFAPELAKFKDSARLQQAMAYALTGGGKRMRPLLLRETAAIFDCKHRAMSAALAVEAIHCYSLAHDDLPDMDNDDLRRGKPSLHKAFDNATAILAGDGLQAMAFELIAKDENLEAATRIKLLLLLAETAGSKGMVGGQMLDLAAEGRFENQPICDLTADEILHLQALKTGALFRFCCLAGGIIGGASKQQMSALEVYANAFGKAFQISDDILDVTGDSATIGKTAGKDIAQDKGTLVKLWGLQGAQDSLQATIASGLEALEPFGEKAWLLREALIWLATRQK
jgi:farnesyl diphosphate synthase